MALVSENMAREIWHDPRAAVGKRIRYTLKDDWREVIGVVADLRDDGIDQKAPTIVYWPLLQKNFGGGDNVIRSAAYIIRTPRAGSADFSGFAGGVAAEAIRRNRFGRSSPPLDCRCWASRDVCRHRS